MTELTLPSVDLTNCDREPIHIPGSIQPHGLLLALDPETLSILQVAGDTYTALGRRPDDLLNQLVETALGTRATALIQLFSTTELSEPLYIGSFAAPADPTHSLDVVAHRRDKVLILELEPSPPHPESAARTLAKVRQISVALEAAPDLIRLLQVASQEVRRLTGFDRVMIYRFLEDGSGAVAAEDKVSELDAFLHHHYPASDIPKQARALYLQNLIRVIPDAGYTPAPLVPALNSATGRPLDMSDCALRSVSPIHVQYLKNMGVAASMSVSIVVEGALWGLIACHHTIPKLVSYELREACKQVAQVLSQQVKAREEADHHRQMQRLASARDQVLGALTGATSIEQALLESVGELRNLLPADGAAVVFRDRVSQNGHAPTEEQIRGLTAWLRGSSSAEPYTTNSLVQDHSPAEAYAAEASGLIAVAIAGEEPIVLLWFRAEQVETINWAGNPHKPGEPGREFGMLTPRKSFETWKETVRHQSRPWTAPEVDAARRFARAVFDLRQQNTLRELNVQLRRTLDDKETLLAQKDLLMQEVHHRVQNSLQLVNSMLSLQARQITDPDVRAHFDEASRRIMAVSMVHRRLWRADHVESVDFSSYLEELRDGLLETWGSAWAGQIKIFARQVLIPTDQAVVLALVVTELLTNAVKYAYQGNPGPVDVTVREEGRKSLRIIVRDQGIGVQESVPKSGLGSRLVRSLVGQIGGELGMEAGSPGTSFTLIVPVTPVAKPS